MTKEFNKNDKQHSFNQIKGTLSEINDDDIYCSITLDVGHENKRQVNIVCRKNQFDEQLKDYKVGEKVCVMFFVTSRKKNERFYTSANLLSIHRE